MPDSAEPTRLTFAIISHPDAGKTTITEKLLLFGGAIHVAGAVKSGKNARTTVSDFMAMEKERGISISTSVMGFVYRGRRFNLLDTPGHADFSEDTYRTLTAVDSALMVIDSVKGVEERTRQLCEVARMRATPIMTFMNKLDREGKDPVELLDETERELDLKVSPLTWPIGQGSAFKGVYSLRTGRIVLFKPHQTQDFPELVIEDIADRRLDEAVGSHLADKLREDMELIRGVHPEFRVEDYLSGRVTPVFFGSALNNFGVQELIDALADMAPPPLPKPTVDGRLIDPSMPEMSGFVFKIHANLDPRHRDRVAFFRVCSGVFERNELYHHVRSARSFRSANPTAFMAQNRDIVERAFPGDIIGFHDTGNLEIGDTLTGGSRFQFKGIPRFAPQIFRSVINTDPLKSKQFQKGLEQLAEEGVVQLFLRKQTNQRILGVVGQLQLEVVQYRLEHEYGAGCKYEPVDFTTACWITCPDPKKLEAFVSRFASRIVYDQDDRPVFLAENRWVLDRTLKDFPEIKGWATSDLEDPRGSLR